jgi:hypothetical protein
MSWSTAFAIGALLGLPLSYYINGYVTGFSYVWAIGWTFVATSLLYRRYRQ